MAESRPSESGSTVLESLPYLKKILDSACKDYDIDPNKECFFPKPITADDFIKMMTEFTELCLINSDEIKRGMAVEVPILPTDIPVSPSHGQCDDFGPETPFLKKSKRSANVPIVDLLNSPRGKVLQRLKFPKWTEVSLKSRPRYITLQFWEKCERTFKEVIKTHLGSDVTCPTVSSGLTGPHRRVAEASIRKTLIFLKPLINLLIFIRQYSPSTDKQTQIETKEPELTDEEQIAAMLLELEKIASCSPFKEGAAPPSTVEELRKKLSDMWLKQDKFTCLIIFMMSRFLNILRSMGIDSSVEQMRRYMGYVHRLNSVIGNLRKQCDLMRLKSTILEELGNVAFICCVNEQICVACINLDEEANFIMYYFRRMRTRCIVSPHEYREFVLGGF